MRLSQDEVYFSIDVETDGPCPGLNSMMQLGCVAYNQKGEELGIFERNLLPVPGCSPDPKTMSWWSAKRQFERFLELQKDRVDALVAMVEWLQWMSQFVGKPVMIAYPSSFDFSWMLYYCWRFLGECPFGHSRVIDIKNLAYALTPVEFTKVGKKYFPEQWMKGLPAHTHRAADDAREQGRLFFNIVKELRRQEWEREDDGR